MSGITIQNKVAEKLAASGRKVEEIIVNELADAEISKRVDLVKKGMKKLEELKEGFKKTNQPDIKTVTGTPGQQGEKQATYSEQRWNDIEKADKAIKELEATIVDALDTNSKEAYDKLEKLAK